MKNVLLKNTENVNGISFRFRKHWSDMCVTKGHQGIAIIHVTAPIVFYSSNHRFELDLSANKCDLKEQF